MSSSEAQVAANRRNALKSTGPKTLEGKLRSRANALKHGLCATVVVAEDAALIQKRAFDWYYALKPQNAYQGWMVDQVAVISLRIDRCERIERRLRDRRSLRAELVWEDDRRLESEILANGLDNRPTEVVEELRRTPTGCDWLISRWALLAYAANTSGTWTENQARLASRLLGVPDEFRETQSPGLVVDRNGEVIELAEDKAAMARREVAELVEHRELVADLDDVDRALSEADLLDESYPELKQVRRLESTLHRRLRWCLAQLKYESPHRRPHPDLKPTWLVTTPTSTDLEHPGAGPASEPPLVPVEPSAIQEPPESPAVEPEPADEPAELGASEILSYRVEQRLKKAEARREAHKRKQERQRA